MNSKYYGKSILQLPKDKKVFETAITYYWLEDDIMYAVAKNKRRNLKNIAELVDELKGFLRKKKIFLLCDLTLGRTYSMEERAMIKRGLLQYLKGVAILSASPMGKMLGQTLLKKELPDIPVKEFDSTEDAEEWIRELKMRDFQ